MPMSMSKTINPSNINQVAISSAAEQWLNLVMAHIEHKRQVKKHNKNKNKHGK